MARTPLRRCTLHITKLENFKEWLNETGRAHRPGKGDYQVLQVMTDDKGWQCIFSRHDMPEHFTVQDALMPVVWKYLAVMATRKIKQK